MSAIASSTEENPLRKVDALVCMTGESDKVQTTVNLQVRSGNQKLQYNVQAFTAAAYRTTIDDCLLTNTITTTRGAYKRTGTCRTDVINTSQ